MVKWPVLGSRTHEGRSNGCAARGEARDRRVLRALEPLEMKEKGFPKLVMPLRSFKII